MATDPNPLTATPPNEVPLPDAPLVHVVTQIRFPPILSVGSRDFVAPFQEAVRGVYPILRPDQVQDFAPPPREATSLPPQMIWRFTDEDGAWQVSLTSNFVSLDTKAYASREDFFTRLDAVLAALAKHVGPRTVDRVGVRYIDRITGDALERINSLIRPEMLGIAATTVRESARHALSDNLFAVPDTSAQLLARWGFMPKDTTIDPAAVEVLSVPSWILDLDMFRHKPGSFSPAETAAEARSFAERIYTFFRWAVTDDFLKLYGGGK